VVDYFLPGCVLWWYWGRRRGSWRKSWALSRKRKCRRNKGLLLNIFDLRTGPRLRICRCVEGPSRKWDLTSKGVRGWVSYP
jgi:hypothetical protein